MTDILAQYGTLIYLLVIVALSPRSDQAPAKQQSSPPCRTTSRRATKSVNHGGVIGTIVDVRDDKITVRIGLTR